MEYIYIYGIFWCIPYVGWFLVCSHHPMKKKTQFDPPGGWLEDFASAAPRKVPSLFSWMSSESKMWSWNMNMKWSLDDMAVCQNLVPLVNIKIAGKWMFIPLKMVCIGIDPYPYLLYLLLSLSCITWWWHFFECVLFLVVNVVNPTPHNSQFLIPCNS